jgi:hypothetical protein
MVILLAGIAVCLVHAVALAGGAGQVLQAFPAERLHVLQWSHGLGDGARAPLWGFVAGGLASLGSRLMAPPDAARLVGTTLARHDLAQRWLTSRREVRMLLSCAAAIFTILVLADRALAPAVVP